MTVGVRGQMTLSSRERREFKRRAIGEIESCLGTAGWAAIRWRRSGRLFAHVEPVTPYFLLADLAGRQWGGYVIEGMFGVLHRPFEQLWLPSAAGRGEEEPMTVALHTANFKQLNTTSHITQMTSSSLK